jgi:hypothetical protein
MLRHIIEELAAAISITLFIGMIAVWASIGQTVIVW